MPPAVRDSGDLLKPLQEDRFDFEEGPHKSADGLETLQAGAEYDLMPRFGIRLGMMKMPYRSHSASHKSFPFCSILGRGRTLSRIPSYPSSLTVMGMLLCCQQFVTLQFTHRFVGKAAARHSTRFRHRPQAGESRRSAIKNRAVHARHSVKGGAKSGPAVIDFLFSP